MSITRTDPISSTPRTSVPFLQNPETAEAIWLMAERNVILATGSRRASGWPLSSMKHGGVGRLPGIGNPMRMRRFTCWQANSASGRVPPTSP